MTLMSLYDQRATIYQLLAHCLYDDEMGSKSDSALAFKIFKHFSMYKLVYVFNELTVFVTEFQNIMLGSPAEYL